MRAMLGLEVSVDIDYFAFRHRHNCFLGGWGLARDNTSIDVLAALFAQLPHRVNCLYVYTVHFFDGFYDFQLIRF